MEEFISKKERLKLVVSCALFSFKEHVNLSSLMKTKLYIVLQVKKTKFLCNGCLGKQSLSPHWGKYWKKAIDL